MSLLPENRTLTSTPSEHLNDHLQVHEKLNAIHDVVADYGATGDGVTNDSTAIQNALDAADTAGGGIVFLPIGEYLTGTTTLEIPANTTLMGAGWATIITYTGTGTAIRAKDYATASQKFDIRCQGFKLQADTAAIGIDAKAWSYSSIDRCYIQGDADTTPTASSVGILFDGSHGALIGCWFNVVDRCFVEGWDTGIKFTGVDAAGQANENTVHKTRVGFHATYGIHVDIGDHVIIDDCDLTSATAGTTGLYINDGECIVLPCRFEATDTAIQVGASAKRTTIHPQFFSDNTTAIQIDSGALDTFVHDGSIFFSVTNKYADSGTQNRTNRTRMVGTSLVPLHFTQENVPANQTNVALLPVGSVGGSFLSYIGQHYQIRGVSVRGTASVSAGTLTLKPTVSTTESTTLSIVMSSGNAAQAWQGVGADTNDGLSGVGCEITTSSGFAPTTMDINVIVWVELVREV